MVSVLLMRISLRSVGLTIHRFVVVMRSRKFAVAFRAGLPIASEIEFSVFFMVEFTVMFRIRLSVVSGIELSIFFRAKFAVVFRVRFTVLISRVRPPLVVLFALVIRILLHRVCTVLVLTVVSVHLRWVASGVRSIHIWLVANRVRSIHLR